MNAKFTRTQAERLRKLREEVAILKASQGDALLELERALVAAGLGALNSAPMPPRAAGDTTVPQWVIKAANYADTIRDALEPFDSGTRPADDPTPRGATQPTWPASLRSGER